LNEAKGIAKAESNPETLTFLLGDVVKRETWEQALSTAQEKYGRVDVVVNNAGITHKPAPVHELDIEMYEKVFNVNLKVRTCS
jgi:NAD(P)-dependent dehydrogenase (short-subunit alcohol dehydrogenase family)